MIGTLFLAPCPLHAGDNLHALDLLKRIAYAHRVKEAAHADLFEIGLPIRIGQ